MADLKPDELPTDALLAIQAGRKVEAIKIVREQTGLDLAQAKRLVDRMSPGSGMSLGKKVNATEDSGVLRLVAALVVLGGIAAAIFLL